MAMYPDTDAGFFFQVIVAGGGVFVYSPAPGAGNLVASVAAAAGADTFGNAYPAGVTTYGTGGPRVVAGQLSAGQLDWLSAATEAGPYVQAASIQFTPGLTGTTSGFITVGNAGSSVSYVLASGDATGTDDTNALAQALAASGTVYLLSGTYHLLCGDSRLTALGPGQWIICQGDLSTVINAHGSGDLFRWVHTGAISDGTTTGGGLIGGATIDGSACSGAAVGIHAGDINGLRFDCRCQHFAKTGGSWGFVFDNANNFTERLHLNIRTKDCGFAGGDGGHVSATVTSPGGLLTSTASFARMRGRIEFTAGSNQQDFLVLNNGAHIYDHELELIGNHQGNAVNPTTAAVIRIIGTVPAGHPGAGTRSAISNGRLDIGIECSSATNSPTTVVQGTSSNSVTDCYGNVNWNKNFTSSGITGAGWKYDGQVQGDTALGTRRYYGTAATQTITGNGQTISSTVPSAKIPVTSAGPFTGLILSAGDSEGQLITVINTGGSNLTFAASPGSNLSAGVNTLLNPGGKLILIWDAGSALWY